MEFTIRADTSEVDSYLKEFPQVTFEQARAIYANAVLAADKETKRNATDVLNVRTGALRRSIQNEVDGFDLDSLRASVFSGAFQGSKPIVYAPIHERGGTIKAKNKYLRVPGGPYLNIPIGENKTAVGVMRMTARMVFRKGGYIKKSRNGKWIVWLESEPMFVLKKQVTIKPRLGMEKAADKQIDNVLDALKNIIGEQ